jgi:hypothetical protein
LKEPGGPKKIGLSQKKPGFSQKPGFCLHSGRTSCPEAGVDKEE